MTSPSSASKPGAVVRDVDDHLAEHERTDHVADRGEQPELQDRRAQRWEAETIASLAEQGRRELDVHLGEQQRPAEHDEEEPDREPEALQQPLDPFVVGTGRDQGAEQGADRDEATGHHAEDQDLMHAEPAGSLRTGFGHLDEDVLRRDELAGRQVGCRVLAHRSINLATGEGPGVNPRWQARSAESPRLRDRGRVRCGQSLHCPDASISIPCQNATRPLMRRARGEGWR